MGWFWNTGPGDMAVNDPAVLLVEAESATVWVTRRAVSRVRPGSFIRGHG